MCMLRTVLALWLLIEVCERKQVLQLRSCHHSPRGSLARPRKKVWCFSLFLFGVGLLTDNVIQPAHSHWVRPESFPSFLMAGICSWHINQTYKTFKPLFQQTGRHHYYFVQINVLVLWKIHPLCKCVLRLNNYLDSCQTVFQNVTHLSFWGLWLSHTTSLKNSGHGTGPRYQSLLKKP